MKEIFSKSIRTFSPGKSDIEGYRKTTGSIRLPNEFRSQTSKYPDLPNDKSDLKRFIDIWGSYYDHMRNAAMNYLVPPERGEVLYELRGYKERVDRAMKKLGLDPKSRVTSDSSEKNSDEYYGLMSTKDGTFNGNNRKNRNTSDVSSVRQFRSADEAISYYEKKYPKAELYLVKWDANKNEWIDIE